MEAEEMEAEIETMAEERTADSEEAGYASGLGL